MCIVNDRFVVKYFGDNFIDVGIVYFDPVPCFADYTTQFHGSFPFTFNVLCLSPLNYFNCSNEYMLPLYSYENSPINLFKIYLMYPVAVELLAMTYNFCIFHHRKVQRQFKSCKIIRLKLLATLLV